MSQEEHQIGFVMKRSEEAMPFRDTPIVADGVLRPDGSVAIAWRGKRPSLALYACPEDMVAVHGHGQTLFTARDDTWEMILDPWHSDAFKGTPGEGHIGNSGDRRVVWATVDAWGNTTSILGPAGDKSTIEHLLAIWKEQDAARNAGRDTMPNIRYELDVVTVPEASAGT
jgi:hypothetical protein